MSLNFKFIGWNTRDGADKVWGVIYLESLPERHPAFGTSYSYVKTVTFWGRRGARLQTKIGQDDVLLAKLIDKKIASGYDRVEPNKLDSVYPEFYSDLEKTAIWSMLKI